MSASYGRVSYWSKRWCRVRTNVLRECGSSIMQGMNAFVGIFGHMLAEKVEKQCQGPVSLAPWIE